MLCLEELDELEEEDRLMLIYYPEYMAQLDKLIVPFLPAPPETPIRWSDHVVS